jgi:polar amino acid transport system substrate-binding protein
MGAGMAGQDDLGAGQSAGRDGKALRRGLLRGSAAGILAASALGARSAAAQGAPQSRLYDVLKRGHLVVGTGSTNPPWHFEDENANLVGFDVDMGRIIAKACSTTPPRSSSCAKANPRAFPTC